MLLSALSSCGSLDNMNLNPDTPTTVTPDFLATEIILQNTTSDASKWLFGDSWIVKSTSSTEHMEWWLYNKFERGSFSNYTILTDSKKMVELAEANASYSDATKNAYRGLDHFIQAYVYYGLTMQMGDIPCSEAVKGESDAIFSPAYDSQEKVFGTILNDLQSAYNEFGSASTFGGDPIFSGDPAMWQRTVNSFELRVLMMLSKKNTVDGKSVQSLFEEVAARPLLTDDENSFARTFSATVSSQWYPYYYEKQNFWAYPVMTSFFVNMMKNLNDYRLFYYAEPATAITDKAANTFDAYNGVDPNIEYGLVQQGATEGKYSAENKRYYRLPQGEPRKFICYSETQFVLAEAALKGWKTPLSAKEHYENGVRAAMKFTANHTPEEYRHGVTIDDAYIDSYLKGAAAFKASEGLKQIMIQKYIGSFVQLPFNSYYDYRRTGLPEIPIDPTTNMNEVKTQLPIRWMYPQEEYSQNKTNIASAIQSQFGGSDTPNDVMWLLK